MSKQAKTTPQSCKKEDDTTIQEIPEECLAKAMGMTTPADACRAAAVSAAFRAAADSDAVWERFLPPDCDAVLERAVHLVDSSSKKELFLELAQEHALLDDGKTSFGLHRSTGAKCYMLSVRRLQIAWGLTDIYWRQRSDPDSRFSKIAELISVCWFCISASIDRRELTPRTHYAGYLVFKLAHGASGLSSPRQVCFVEVDGQQVGPIRRASFHPCSRPSCTMTTAGGGKGPHEHEEEGGEVCVVVTRYASFHPCSRPSCTMMTAGGGGGGEGCVVVTRYPRQRAEDDGWLELEIGDFHTVAGDEDDDRDISVGVREFEELQWKKGLVVEGIEIRPKN